jgi:glycogen synthase
VVLHNNICLQFAWPLVFVRRPWVVAHHTWIRRTDGRIAMIDKIKRCVSKRARQVGVSKAIADDVKGCHQIIGNCYDSGMFRRLDHVPRDLDIVFLGRLVDDKGADLAIQSVSELTKRNIDVTLSIIGSGPEEEALRQLAKKESVGKNVHFVGTLKDESLVHALNQHQVMVVPSRWKEPFGLVALEGIACGCVVVGSDGGGLKDAIGPCGATFPNGDLNSLVDALTRLLNDPRSVEKFRAEAPAHLERHTPQKVAAEYLRVLEGALH